MTAQPITGLGSELSQHAMHLSINGLRDNIIPAYDAVKTLLIKEPAKAQRDEEGEGRDSSGSLSL